MTRTPRFKMAFLLLHSMHGGGGAFLPYIFSTIVRRKASLSTSCGVSHPGRRKENACPSAWRGVDQRHAASAYGNNEQWREKRERRVQAKPIMLARAGVMAAKTSTGGLWTAGISGSVSLFQFAVSPTYPSCNQWRRGLKHLNGGGGGGWQYLYQLAPKAEEKANGGHHGGVAQCTRFGGCDAV